MGAYLETLPTRILLVEDFKPQRFLIASVLARTLDLQPIAEALDGLEAVEKAQQLRPDVILIDIGLPKLDGVEAARRIRLLVPTAKIIFLTLEEDLDFVREAFRLGAWGYVLKQETETDLPAALTEVQGGRKFVSRRLGDSGLTLATSPSRQKRP